MGLVGRIFQIWSGFVAFTQTFLDFHSRTGKDSFMLKDRYLTKHLFEDLAKNQTHPLSMLNRDYIHPDLNSCSARDSIVSESQWVLSFLLTLLDI